MELKKMIYDDYLNLKNVIKHNTIIFYFVVHFINIT